MPLAVHKFAAHTRHHEALNWASRVVTAGGIVNVQTLDAVSRFCRDIEQAGIRDKFYRLNLLCGDFTAAQVPLYTNTSFAGSVLGNTTDTNFNFVSGDYAETGTNTGGLKGNGSTKYLDTGVNPVTIGASSSDFHLAIYSKGASATGTTRGYIGNAVGNNNETFIGITSGGTTENAGIACASGERRTAPAGTKEGLLLITTDGSRSQTYYLNGTASATTTATNSFGNASVFVFRASAFYALAQYIRTYSIGLGMDATEEANYRAAVERFNDALGRKV